MNSKNFNTAQMLLMMIGGTAAGQAFGMNQQRVFGSKRGFTKSPKAMPRKKFHAQSLSGV